jgi:two-component system, NtrC family, response regulator HydG
MRATDLDLRELLHFEPKGGILRFGGQRALLLDAVALGLLRKELIETLGREGARTVLTRFGYAHGWRTAESVKGEFPWDDAAEWKRAGGRLHALQGLVIAVTPAQSEAPGPAPFAEAHWQDSYEAEQHLLHLGRCEHEVCWTLAGFASGYLSYCNGREIYCLEDRCRGKGDAVCHIVGRDKAEWGAQLTPHLPYYRMAGLGTTLQTVTEELKRVERRLRARKRELGDAAAGIDPSGIVASSGAMQRVLELARRVAKVDSTVLVTGESGVGKERVARLIHDESPRIAGPFVALNCGAVPESLLESELFGHLRGAFTGAAQDRPGLFEAANGGTIFLDEIGEVPPAMQVKLLRVLQEGEVRRVGDAKTRRVDVRVIAATNRDLLAEVHAARFRQDLYYRLRVIELRVPALRERREDILPLARVFLSAMAQRAGSGVTGISTQAACQLARYAWPGNVRELENAIERAVVFAGGSAVELDDLPEEIGMALPAASAPGEVRPLAEIERDYILAVLRANAGNKVKAAAQLQIGTATLYRKLRHYEAAAVAAARASRATRPRRASSGARGARVSWQAMQLRPFSLERYFSQHEFTAKYLLGSSDPEAMTLGELLTYEPAARAQLETLWLGYTEYCGHPALRHAIAERYTNNPAEHVLVFSGAEEPIFTFMNVALEPGDHLIAQWPGYQSHYEVARAVGAEITYWKADPARGWALDPEELARLLRPDTKAILVSSPHNPTGFHFEASAWARVIELARRHGAWLFSDEVYRGLEHDPQDQLACAADLYERAVSINGTSKSYGLAGLRIGWLVTQDRALFAKLGAFKDYLTISNAAPSELLATIAVRHSDELWARSRARLVSNVARLDAFVARHHAHLRWTRPRAGTTAFVRYLGASATALCDRLLRERGIMLVPSPHFDCGDHHLRFGYGRANFAEVLAMLEDALAMPA